MKRRDFLGRVTGAIAALGICDAGWLRLGDRYYQALAQSTYRKLALLVGINSYPPTQSLSGCLTDVELQRELLIHRFGFQSADILTLTDRQATRQQIETAFREHLIEQAQAGDVVIFHFSGYGRHLQKKAGGDEEQPLTYNSLVCVDGDDLLDETLWLLLRSLSTKNITTILDTSFNLPGTVLPGMRVRSFPETIQGHSAAELVQLQQKFQQQSSTIPGVILTAAGSTGSAVEVKWAGFSAGLFTYALTQHLWEATAPTMQVSLTRVSGVIEQLVGNEQQPQLSKQKNQEPFEAYSISSEPSIGADGVVKLVEEDSRTVQLWLAGIPPLVLEYYEVGSKVTLVPPLAASSLTTPLQLQVRSRVGLIAKAQVVGENNSSLLKVGQLIHEAVRVIPRNIRLAIALGPSLERIERVDATSAFAAIPFISIVTSTEQRADYIFGRVAEVKPSEIPDVGASPRRYGLFLNQSIVPNTVGELGEAVKVAVQRLVPKLQTLLAAKLWRLTTNEGSSLLKVKATLESVNSSEQAILQRETRRSQQMRVNTSSYTYSLLGLKPPTSDSMPTLPIGNRMQYRVSNDSDRPVYLLLLGLDSSKNAIALYSTQGATAKPILQDVAIDPGETLIVPQTTVDFDWVIRKPAGWAEHQLIFSSASFTQTLAVMATAMQDTGQRYIGGLLNPLEVVQAMMQDLHNASAIAVGQSTSSNTESLRTTADSYALDVNHWASLSFVYQIA